MLRILACAALALAQSDEVAARGALRAGGGGRDGVSDLQMLIPLLIEDSQAEQARSAPSPSAPRYTDGPFSDIPAEAFLMEPSKASDKHKSTKKALGRFRAASPPAPSPPDAVVAGCVRYFQGRAGGAPVHDTEALLQLCTEILDDADVEDVVHIHVDEERCPAAEAREEPLTEPRVQSLAEPRAHELPESAGAQALGPLLQSLVQLLSGHSRRRWLIMNSNHPDPQMREFVDVEM